MNKEECNKLMRERDYLLIAERYGPNRTEMIYIFNLEDNSRFPTPKYNVIVTLETEEFKAEWIIPNSINKLTTGQCGLVKDEDHFFNIITKFERHCSYINKYVQYEE